MQQGGVVEAKAKLGGRDKEEQTVELLSLRESFDGGVRVQITWECSERFGRQLVGCGGKFEEGAEAVGKDVDDFRAEGSRPPFLRGILKISGTSDTPVWHRVVGGVTLDWDKHGRFPPHGGTPAGKDAAEEDWGE